MKNNLRTLQSCKSREGQRDAFARERAGGGPGSYDSFARDGAIRIRRLWRSGLRPTKSAAARDSFLKPVEPRTGNLSLVQLGIKDQKVRYLQ